MENTDRRPRRRQQTQHRHTHRFFIWRTGDRCRSRVRVGSSFSLLLYPSATMFCRRLTLDHNHSVGHHKNYAIEMENSVFEIF